MRRHGTWVGLIALPTLLAPPSHGQAPDGLPDAIVREIRAAARPPSGKYTFVREWEAETAGHNTGHLADDPDARGGKAWEATAGVDAPGTLLYGPYIEVEPGDYVAFFRIRLLEPLEDDVIGHLDACVSYAQDMLARSDLRGADLMAGKYAQVPLGFRYQGGRLECRITWPGDVSLRVDRITLFRIEGADPSQVLGRVPAAVPSGKPTSLAYYSEPRPFPDVFPRSRPPAKELVVCDLRKERADLRLLVYSLQGLVNRAEPRLYCLSAPIDSQWLDYLGQRGWIQSTHHVAALDLLHRFRDSYKGVVVTDPYLPASKNVATMIASVKDGLVASPRLAKRLSLPVLDDLRGRWNTSAQAYRWAFDDLWPQLNHHVLACSWPDHLPLRDYLVQHKVFIFWLSGPLDGAREYASPDDEVRLMEDLFAKMPVNIPVMSYPYAGKEVGIGEGPGVTLFAEFAKYLVGSINCANLSVHSGVAAQLRQKPAPPAPTLRNDKVYISFVISDGDNLPVLTNGNFPQLWRDEARGRFPIGWTVSPSASLLIPDIVDYYYRTATPNDYFIGAVSGVGYTYPDVYGKRYRQPDRQRVYDEFLDQTATYMKRCDLRGIWIMNATRPDVIARYAERIPFLEALFPDYGRRVSPGRDPTYPTARNVPVFRAVGRWRQDATREQRIEELVADVRRMTPPHRPAFLHVFALNWFTDLPLLQEALDRLAPDYVAVRPDHLARLWRRAMDDAVVLARLPFVAAGVEGADLALAGTLRNMSDEDQEVQLQVTAGMDAPSLAPERVRLQPAAEAAFEVTGSPTADTVQVEVRGAFGTRTMTVTLRWIPRSELGDRLPDGVQLVPASYLEAEDLPHRSGVAQRDPAATNESAWVARVGEAKPGYVVFGPYAPLDAGKYLALFRLKRIGEGDGVVAVVDTCVGGGSPQTGQREISAKDLPLNEYRWFPVEFRHPGGGFETRVQWSGAASLSVDAIAVWRLHQP
ncbi:MAG: GxGYxYP domain-containing protein [Armatimonadota bacterium]